MAELSLNFIDDTTTGLDRLVHKVETEVLFSGAAATARVFYDEAKAQAEKHVKTGELYNAIYRVHAPEKSTPEKVTYEVSWNKTKAPHGHLLEFGTARAPAYPFIRPAFARAADAVEAGKARMAERFSEVQVDP